MIRVLHDFRLLPVVLLAIASLLVLKSFGLVFDGWYILGPPVQEQVRAPTADMGDAGDIVGSIGEPAKPAPAIPDEPAVTAPVMPAAPAAAPSARQSWAQEMFGFPDITGSVGGADNGKGAAPAAPGAKSAAAGKAPAAPAETPAKPGETTVRNESAARPQLRSAARDATAEPDEGMRRRVSPSERAILERLQERRKGLEVRAGELEMREALMKAAEKRLEARIAELKQMQESAKAAVDNKDEVTSERLKSLIAMYENMKAKDAARIFDRLDLKILVELAGRINPRRMSDILANMSSEAAERLTVEFASRGGASRSPSPADLPKIEGRPDPAR